MLNMTDYAKRRKALLKKIGPTGMIILPSAAEIPRNGDAVYPFRQQSDFYYLTGFQEPEAVLLLIPERKQGEYILFNRVRDRDREIWDGPRAGQAGACKDFHADQAFPIEEFITRLPELLLGKETIHYPLGLNKAFDDILFTAINNL